MSMMKNMLGVFEQAASGLLVPRREIVRIKHKDSKGNITDVEKKYIESLYDDVVKHYESKTGKSFTTSRKTLTRFRDMCKRAADAIVKR